VDKFTLAKDPSGREAIEVRDHRIVETHPVAVGFHGISQALSVQLPCALYQADVSLRLSYVSENIIELLGLESRAVVGNEKFWERRVLDSDWGLFVAKMEELRVSGSAALIHRMVDSRDLPVWVSHKMKRVAVDGEEVILGSLTPVGGDPKIHGPDANAIGEFVHKIGNHFQLMNLVANSLGKTMSGTTGRDIDALQEAIERAVDLVRAFSDYSQPPACLPQIELAEVIKAAVLSTRRSFHEKEVTLEQNIGASVDDASVSGDPFLLESALGHILENALEATPVAGVVALSADVESDGRRSFVARIRVKDFGGGIDTNDLARVTLPFFTLKKDRAGLGLSLSSRFIEMHGGVLRIRSEVGKGTEVEISLPVVGAGKDAL
jgi:hypothetical protein